MQVVRTTDPVPTSYRKSLFLAGPTVTEGKSWRTEALSILTDMHYDGVVFVPEGEFEDYETQCSWEDRCMGQADAIVFWIPRILPELPGLTTNIEFGQYCRSGRCVVGAPQGADKVEYIFRRCRLLGVPSYYHLKDVLGKALEMIGEGELRTGVETQVPLTLWRSRAWKGWYADLKKSSNTLQSVLNQDYWSSPIYDPVVTSFHPVVSIGSEGDRVKENESVIGRPDITAVALFSEDGHKILLVQEFRTACRLPNGKVLELPGGSLEDGETPLDGAVRELEEETGLKVASDRLTAVGVYQLAPSLSTFSAYLFMGKLTDKELADFEFHDRQQTQYGHDEGEVTFVRVRPVSQILAGFYDLATKGMIATALIV